VQEKLVQQANPQTFENHALLSGGLKSLLAVLVLATVALLISRVFQVITPELAAMIAACFVLAGVALGIFTHIWLLVRIFEQSIGWGFGALFIPLVGLIAVAMFWEKTKRSFVGQMVCVAIVVVGYLMVPASMWVPTASR
jgi:hypothetical protein